MSTVERHDTGASPSGDVTRDYVLSIRNGAGTLVARYFLYDCPLMLSDGEQPEHFAFNGEAFGSVERLLTELPINEEPTFAPQEWVAERRAETGEEPTFDVKESEHE